MSERANKRTSELPNTKVALSACIILHCATKRAREQIFSLLSRRAEETRTAFTFLGATKHLYKRVCPSVRRSVRQAFVKNKGNQSLRPHKCQTKFTRLTRRILAALKDALYVSQSVSPSVCWSKRIYRIIMQSFHQH